MLNAQELLAAYRRTDPTASGAVIVTVVGKTVEVAGKLVTTHPTPEEVFTPLLQEVVPELTPVYHWTVTPHEDLAVIIRGEETESATTIPQETVLDRVSVLYQGSLPFSLLQETKSYKLENWDTLRKVEACVEVVGFLAPIVVDRQLRVIDGNMRLTIAKNLFKYGVTTTPTVPVVIVDDEGVRSDFLRLVLNRSTEFQRWLYAEVDEYVDGHPQLQPLLEPLGFFGERILPTSFFGNTVMDYELDPYNRQQQLYRQEIGLATWAQLQRERLQKEKEAKKKRRAKPATPTTVSLFDLVAEDTDFIPTYDAPGEAEKVVQATKEMAEVLTQNYDKKRRAEKEAKGQPWQTTRRTSKAVAAAARAKAEEKVRKEEEAEEEA